MLPIRFTDHPPPSDKEDWGDDEHYQAACLLDGQLPIREPDGAYNIVLMAAAARKLPELDAPHDERVVAARELIQLLRIAQQPFPAPLLHLAEQQLPVTVPPSPSKEYGTVFRAQMTDLALRADAAIALTDLERRFATITERTLP
jgi:hypothetical protein